MNQPLNITSDKTESEILILPTCRGFERINCNHIVRIEASSNYSRLFFTDGNTLVVAKVLHWFEKQIGMHMFLRIHRTHLVNKNFIRSYLNGNSGQICLDNGERIQVSKRKKSSFLNSWRAA